MMFIPVSEAEALLTRVFAARGVSEKNARSVAQSLAATKVDNVIDGARLPGERRFAARARAEKEGVALSPAIQALCVDAEEGLN